MVNELVTPNVEAPSSIANSEGTVSIPEEYLGGLSFIKFKLDKDRNLLINDTTGEESPELLVRICGVKMERVLIEEGDLLCVSRDGKYSKDGVMCETCPNVYNSPFVDADEQRIRYMASCKKYNIENPPEWNSKTKCSFRLVIQWVEQFEKNDDGSSYMWIEQPGLCYLSCPKSSLAAMTFRGTGYLSRLKSKGYGDLKHVVTIIGVGQRRNEKLKINYSYETFEMEGTYDGITKRCVNYNEMMKAMGKAPQITAAPEPVAQIAQKPAPEPIQPELAQPAPKVPAGIAKHAEKQAKAVKATEPAETPKTAEIVPPAASNTEMKLKIKYVFATLPADVQQIVLTVLKVEAIDKITDNDLRVAFETLELAKSEVAGRAVEPKQPETPAPAVTPTTAQKPRTPW
jgi:hypothetical protein